MMFAVCILSLLLWVDPTSGCVCMPVHFGTRVCQSPLVFEGTVVKNDVNDVSNEMEYFMRPDLAIYNVTIHKVYRANHNEITDGEMVQVFARGQRTSCGISMQSGEKYLIARTILKPGPVTVWNLNQSPQAMSSSYEGEFTIFACDLVTKMTSLTSVQVEGINGGYDCSCDHESFLSDEAGPAKSNTCRMQKAYDYSWWCYNDGGMCARDDDDVCRWKLDKSNCI